MMFQNLFKPKPPVQSAPVVDTFKLGSRFYYAQLPADDKIWYRNLYDAWVGGSAKAAFKMPGNGFETPSGMPFLDLCLAVNEDNPHLFHIEYTHFFYKRTGNHVEIWTENVYTPAQFQEVYDRLRIAVDKILVKAKTYSSKYDQVRFLHDYLAGSIRYDTGKPDAKSQREVHTIVGSLLNHACVCDGYARAFRLLCDLLHISCIVIIGQGPTDGNAEKHAWNLLKLDDRVYHVDVTWDSNMSEERMIKDYEFMRSDAMAGRRHSWLRDKYPWCKKDYPRREPLVDTPDKLDYVIKKYLEARRKSFQIRLGGHLASEAVFGSAIKNICKQYSHLLPKQGELRYWFYEAYGYAEFFYVKH